MRRSSVRYVENDKSLFDGRSAFIVQIGEDYWHVMLDDCNEQMYSSPHPYGECYDIAAAWVDGGELPEKV